MGIRNNPNPLIILTINAVSQSRAVTCWYSS
uniref:Uncharacterized protein n=1 Tax=Anguilla anguilla TaxID=7936 RepID=A0A0E9VUW1_ANGAN